MPRQELKIKRVPTGIPHFDNLINGGLRDNSINLVAGSAGSGKTIFTIQFLINGIEKYNSMRICLDSGGTWQNTKERVNSYF